MFDPRMGLWQPGSPDSVLVVDGIVFGLLGVRSTIERCLRLGAAQAAGVVGDVLNHESPLQRLPYPLSILRGCPSAIGS
jgi:hypothetical protein